MSPDSADPQGAGGGWWVITRAWVRSAFVDHIPIKFVALVLSLTLFILVNSDRDAVIGAYVKVSYTMPDDRVLVSEPVDQIRLTVRGPWRRIRRFDERELERVNVDLTDRGDGEISFRQDQIRLPQGLELVSIAPSSVRVEFEPRTEQIVPVDVEIGGVPAAGYRVRRATATPDKVRIRGGQSALAETDAIRTRELRVDERSASFTERVELIAPDRLRLGDLSSVEVRVELEEIVTSRQYKDVAVEVVGGSGLTAPIDDRFTAEPRVVTVTLRGPAPLLETLDQGTIHALVKVFGDDVVSNKARRAQVEIRGVPQGIAIEVSPREVMVAHGAQ